MLFVSGIVPFPPTNGLAMRSSAFVEALADEGHEVHLAAFGTTPEATHPDVLRFCRTTHLVPLRLTIASAAADYWGRLRRLPSAIPYGTLRFASAEMRRLIEQVIEQEHIEAVVCDTLDCMVNLPQPCKVPVLLNNHNVEHLILERFLQYERNAFRWAYAWLEARKLRRWEREGCRRAGVTVVCSHHDRHALESLGPGTMVYVVPNVIDTDSYQPAPGAGRALLTYTGGMDWYPNRDAVQFFLSSIFPAVHRVAPEAQFVVAGRNVAPEFQARFAHIPGVTFTGTVPDIRPVIADSDVCVVPLRIGSGTRLKILEAAAMAKPIVSTRLGAEGLEFEEETEIMLADTPEEFSAAVIRLLHDPELRSRLGASARKRVERSYSRLVLREKLRVAVLALERGGVSGNSPDAATMCHAGGARGAGCQIN